MMTITMRETFTTPYEQYQDREGEPFIVLRTLTDDERDPEVGTMYRIRFEDGSEIDAWPEEVESSLAIHAAWAARDGGVEGLQEFFGVHAEHRDMSNV